MIVFFDTNVHVDLLRGRLSLDSLLAKVGGGPIRMSPVVASELLRGARGQAARAVEKLVARLLPIEPPSWRRCWLDSGRIVRALYDDFEEIGLARLQNDVLLALTAHHTGAALVTQDRHFAALQQRADFVLVPPTP